MLNVISYLALLQHLTNSVIGNLFQDLFCTETPK